MVVLKFRLWYNAGMPLLLKKLLEFVSIQAVEGLLLPIVLTQEYPVGFGYAKLVVIIILLIGDIVGSIYVFRQR